MPRNVRAPKITIGISRISQIFGLWSKIPIPISNAVTTAQIVRTMKRGENGSSSVSIEPSAKLFLPAGSLVQPIRQAHTVYGPALADRFGRALLQCSVTVRHRRSVAVQPHLVRNLALLQPVLGQPGVGGE